MKFNKQKQTKNKFIIFFKINLNILYKEKKSVNTLNEKTKQKLLFEQFLLNNQIRDLGLFFSPYT